MGLEREVLKFKSGNEKSFDYIYAETMGLVRFAIYQVIPNRYIVEDLIQDTYMKVSKNIATYTESNFRAWIYRIAKNLAIDYLKKKREKITDSVDILVNEISMHPYLYYAIRHLDEVEREVFLMKVLCGHTTKRISEILGLSKTVVNKTYYEAKEKLKKELEDVKDEI